MWEISYGPKHVLKQFGSQAIPKHMFLIRKYLDIKLLSASGGKILSYKNKSMKDSVLNPLDMSASPSRSTLEYSYCTTHWLPVLEVQKKRNKKIQHLEIHQEKGSTNSTYSNDFQPPPAFQPAGSQRRLMVPAADPATWVHVKKPKARISTVCSY